LDGGLALVKGLYSALIKTELTNLFPYFSDVRSMPVSRNGKYDATYNMETEIKEYTSLPS